MAPSKVIANAHKNYARRRLLSLPTTNTTTEIDTETATVTQTVVAPSPTLCAQCASNNVAGSANGNVGIYQPNYASYNGVSLNQVPINDATQCCVTCAQTAGCVGYSQYAGGPCLLYTVNPSQCDSSSNFGGGTLGDFYFTDPSVGPGAGYIIGNGQCGRFVDGG